MVLESLIKSKRIVKNFWFILLLCFAYVFIGYIVGFIFFGATVSVVTIFTLTLLLLPSLAKIISLEERIDSRHGLRHFFKNNKLVFYAYFAAFLGIFLGYVMLGAVTNYENTLALQKDYLEKSQGINKEVVEGFVRHRQTHTLNQFLALLTQNLGIMLICFVLSLFYGAGAVFLIVLNASVAATFLVYIFRIIADNYQNLVLTCIFLIHLLPEISGFILAAIAGALLSEVIVTERYRSRRFKNVLQNVFMLFLIAAVLIFAGAFLELVVSNRLVWLFLG